MAKKYVSLSKLSTFLDNLKTTFASFSHQHTISDITDYTSITVDDALSDTSVNPVQNQVINAEFDAISEAYTVLEAAIDDKLNISDYIVDTALSDASDNPVQNNVLNAKFSATDTSISNIIRGDTKVGLAAYADHADEANVATKATKDGNDKVISDTYETKADATSKLNEAKSYAESYAKSAAESAANTVKNDLLNGAGEQYDTLKELGDLINENTNALDALELVANGKADIADVSELQSVLTNLQEQLNGKSQVQIITWGDDD